jgi:hypothetical protein
MKLLFSSSDVVEIGRVGREFVEAGIACGVRYDPPKEGASPTPAYAELWVREERDYFRAVVLFLKIGGGSLIGVQNFSRLQNADSTPCLQAA